MAKRKDRKESREKEKKPKKHHKEEKERSPSEEKHSSSRKKHKHSSGSRERDSRRSRDSKSSRNKSSSEKGSNSSKGGSSKDVKKKEKKKKESREHDEWREDESEKGTIQAEIQISENDYFARAKEFKVWLFSKKKAFFEDLTSEQSRELFGKFVKDWNRGKLDRGFYEGSLPEELVAHTSKTQHKWGFVKKLSDRDQMQLERANDSVHASTEVKGVSSNVPVLPTGSAKGAGARVGAATSRDSKKPDHGSVKTKDDVDRRGDRDSDWRTTEGKRKRRQEREKHAVVLDEIAPKETGRQAILDKRREVGAQTHAAARAREDAADGLDMRESDTMGGGDDFRERLARSKMGKQRRQAAKTEHLQELAAKEAEKRAAFMAQMGLKAGEKIVIQPRNDG